jgi:pimeloyl-CoA synthetase
LLKIVISKNQIKYDEDYKNLLKDDLKKEGLDSDFAEKAILISQDKDLILSM